MIARYLARARGHRVLGLATLAGVVQPLHAKQTLPARTVTRSDAVIRGTLIRDWLIRIDGDQVRR
ncbi:hypothetical protein [Rathayibacter toxicus]|uniref:hypothetical protein n=1 Tax=Rathayibacter toxicus TaxID=145458 RepID=UPI001C05E188|nr:hypothetical protein [Rathayibacter toxicus]QWL29532.1 hypothetical protein E2R34_01290 [Rathayibacter toxicus]QWL31616.1 hypothetical protein E2R35_01280 [Rathayibacter toxicus]QWL33708.1 hypothetical protein E2R36_01280 [Rathayibacter toxicus]QWL35842.1 hypothetical protein E2R37_01280 [Rathayibacter toxicus]QWL37932.1 hypothetical protein E2R38_01280 [Rathayibacter toxicus]